MASSCVPPMADAEGADLGERALRGNRLSGHSLLLGTKTARRWAEKPGRSGSGAPTHLREARHPACRTGAPAGVAVDAVFDSVSVATTFREKLEQLGIYFYPF